MNEKILDFEDNEFSEFDYITDFYIPFKDEEQKYSSPELKLFRDNNIDPYELLGEKKVDGIEPITKLKQGKEIEEAKTSFAGSVLDFVKDLPESAFISTAEAMANLTNTGVQLVGFGSNFLFKDSEKGKPISDFTTDIAQNYNKGTESFINSLDTYAKNNDINGVSKLLTDTGIDIGLTFPIQKQLKKVGMPNWLATPLAFGLSYGLTGGDKDVENNMLVDSQVVNRTLELMNVLPNTPEAEIAELVANTFEGTLWAGAIQPITKVFKLLKNNVPAYLNQQTAVSVGGAAAVGETVDKINQNVNPELNVDQPEQPIENLDQEKKTLNQSDTLQDADNLYASAGFGPVFFSMLKEAAKKIPNKGTGQQMFNTIKNMQGVKQTELKWTGLDDFLKDKKSVTKQEIQDYLKYNTLDVAEIQKPRKLTKAEGELELKLESDINEIETNISKLLKKDPNALVLEDLDTYIFKSRTLGSEFAEETEKTGISKMRILLEGLTEDDVLKRFKYKDKIVINNLQLENQPFTRTGPLPVDEADKLIANGTYNRTSRYEFDPLEIKKYFRNLELRKFNNTFEETKPRFADSRYTEAGGKDYQELVFKLKGDKNYPIEKTVSNSTSSSLDPLPDIKIKTGMDYKSPALHFGTKNEFAHVRFKTRDLNGQKVLTVEEMQSDLAQDVKKNLVGGVGKISDYPFKNNWYELVTKRLLRYAADNNFDAVAIPKANPIMKRYQQDAMAIDNLNIKVIRHPRGSMFLDEKDGATSLFPKDAEKPALYRFVVNYKEGDKLRKSLVLDENEIFETLDGYKVSNSVRKQVNEVLENKAKFVADELTIDAPITKMIVGSGKGKVQLYNQAIPSFLKKYGKKWNAQVYDDVIEIPASVPAGNIGYAKDKFGSKMPVTIIKLTDEMKQSIQQDGQALFSLFGLGLGSKIASDSIENNIISDQTN